MHEGSLLGAIAREMPTGVVVLDSDGRILYANPSFLKSFFENGDVEEVVGRDLGTLISDAALLSAVDGFLKGNGGDRPSAGEIEVNEKNRCFKIRMVPAEDGDCFALMLFLQDITEEKMVEAIKKDFVANVSHELRTPLASIKGYSETLLDGGMDDKDTLRDFLKVIDKHATRMSRLIEDLLVLSRLESNQMPMVSEPIDISEVVRSITDGFRKQARDRGIELSMRIEDDVAGVLADRVRIEQVMVTLLDNAIKYTPSGGKVDVIVTADDGCVRVDVKDTGIGIPAPDIPRIFERFYRVDKARSRDLGGTGLGLAIVKHIIQGLNGKVWVESSLSEGSTFSFTLKSAAERV